MYEAFMNTLRRFLGSGDEALPGFLLGSGQMKLAMMIALPVIIFGLVLWASPAFRRWFHGWTERGGWRAFLVAVLGGLYKVPVVFVLVRLLIVAMMFQASAFSQQHGRLTETNRGFVQMKWGSPHEQRELGVNFTRKRTWVTRQLKLPDEIDREGRVMAGRIFSESYWKDEEQPVQAVEGKLPAVISAREDQRDVAVEQKGLRSADVQITLTNNPRRLGNANYAGYEDRWSLKYRVANDQEFPVTAHMRFSLPNDRDFFNKFRLTVDGQDMVGKAKTADGESGGGLAWDYDLKPAQEAAVEISYESRGLEYLRYIPRRMTPTAYYHVAVTVEGVPPNKLNYPIGSTPPAEKLADIKAMPYTLHWTLDNALTSYDIGLQLPQAEQPQYYVSRLLDEAPMGLLLLLVLLVLPRLIIGQPVRLSEVVIMSAAYYLFYTFLGRLNDVLPAFSVAFVIATVALILLVSFYRRGDASRLLARQDLVSFTTLLVLYPLAVIDADRTALWMQIFYLAILLYLSILTVRCRVCGPARAG